MSPWRAALVIARRDYVASVWSRTFLLFLMGPLLPLIAGGLFTVAGAGSSPEPLRPTVTVIARHGEAAAIGRAYAALGRRLGDAVLPALRFVVPARRARTDALVAEAAARSTAVLSGGIDAPVLTGPAGAIASLRQPIALVLDRARAERALARLGPDVAPAPVVLAERPIAEPSPRTPDDRITIARLGQVVLMFLTVLLTGMMVSNMVEEKSNKIIEVLTAAVPVDGIFFGKLVAMLGLSLTGIVVWGAMGVAASLLLAHGGAALPVPAVGWPLFVALGVVYFCAIYLLIGAVFLGIGAQAASVREVQTISMPLTMAQLGVVAFASTALNHLDGPVGIGATIFPWSSPYAMLARAAEQSALWPHAVAILWQAAWVALTIRLVSRWFRISVLKSGTPGKRRWWLQNHMGAANVSGPAEETSR